MERKSIGSFIAALRKANGYTQKELAEKLNVSDKAVSRWERDESAPDISLLPVIAEIFGITTDELLCGERRRMENQATDSTAKSPRTNLKIKNLLAASMRKFKNLSLISLGISALAVLAAMLLDYFVCNDYITVPCMVFLVLTSVVCEIVFVGNILTSVGNDETENELTDNFKINVINCSKKFFAINFYIIFAVCAFACFRAVRILLSEQANSMVAMLNQMMLKSQTLSGYISLISYNIFFVLAVIILGVFAYLLFKALWYFVTGILSKRRRDAAHNSSRQSDIVNAPSPDRFQAISYNVQNRLYPISEEKQRQRRFTMRFLAISLTVVTLTFVCILFFSTGVPDAVNTTFVTETEGMYNVTQSGTAMGMTVFSFTSICAVTVEYIIMALVYLLLTRNKKHSR